MERQTKRRPHLWEIPVRSCHLGSVDLPENDGDDTGRHSLIFPLLSGQNMRVQCRIEGAPISPITRLSGAGLTINLGKCRFGAKTMEFLGHTIGEGAITPQAQEVKAIMDYQRPNDIRSFLGIMNYYSDFIQDCSGIAAPLTDLLQNKHPDPII